MKRNEVDLPASSCIYHTHTKDIHKDVYSMLQLTKIVYLFTTTLYMIEGYRYTW